MPQGSDLPSLVLHTHTEHFLTLVSPQLWFYVATFNLEWIPSILIPLFSLPHPLHLSLSLCLPLSEIIEKAGEEGIPDLVTVMRNLSSESIPNLPPGGGLASK